MADDNALALAIQALAKSTERIADDIRETRRSVDKISEDNRDNAIKLERLLTQVEGFDGKVAKIDQAEKRQDSMEIRLSMIEVQTKELPDIHKRLKILEDYKVKAIGIGTGIIIVLELMFHLVKAFW